MMQSIYHSLSTDVSAVNRTVYNELHSLINNIDLEINFQFRPLLI